MSLLTERFTCLRAVEPCKQAIDDLLLGYAAVWREVFCQVFLAVLDELSHLVAHLTSLLLALSASIEKAGGGNDKEGKDGAKENGAHHLLPVGFGRARNHEWEGEAVPTPLLVSPSASSPQRCAVERRSGLCYAREGDPSTYSGFNASFRYETLTGRPSRSLPPMRRMAFEEKSKQGHRTLLYDMRTKLRCFAFPVKALIVSVEGVTHKP